MNIYIYIYIYMCTYMNAYVCIYKYTHTYACVIRCIHSHTHIYTCRALPMALAPFYHMPRMGPEPIQYRQRVMQLCITYKLQLENNALRIVSVL